jgi:isochorismate synthase
MAAEFASVKRYPFAIWSLPGSTSWKGIRQLDHLINANFDLDSDGFLVAPFDKDKAPKFIRCDQEIQSLYELENLTSIPIPTIANEIVDPIQLSHEQYVTICRSIIDSLKRGEADKVVLSRVKSVSFTTKIIHFFIQLMESYPKAMVFMYSFGNEIWIGASPETLFKGNSTSFSTMALAGSMPVKEDPQWASKEIQEHAYVEHYIEAILKEKALSYVKDGPNTIQAGPVLHLKSDYQGMIDASSIKPLIKALHPTPAVCGIPLEKALALIKQNEQHDRLDYAGFFGPINNNELNLFVNLRSAMISGNKLHLFLGGGITKDSDPEQEWKETEWKAKTLLSIL